MPRASKWVCTSLASARRLTPRACDDALYAEAKRLGLYEHTEELHPALAKSDAVYTDTWIDMEFFTDPKFAREKERRVQTFQPYQLNRELLADLDLKILHCLPAHHGYEIEGALLHDERLADFYPSRKPPAQPEGRAAQAGECPFLSAVRLATSLL